MATKNRFEQVDERQDDAITLMLATEAAAAKGTVVCPAALLPNAQDQVSPALEPVEAFRAAVRLANEIKAPLVVMDPEGLWQAEWGELFRVED